MTEKLHSLRPAPDRDWIEASAPGATRSTAASGGVFGVWLLASLLLLSGSALAQDMEPRSYSNAPVGMNFLLASYGHTSGSVVADTSLPVQDVQAQIHSAAIGYVRALDFFGRSGKVALIVPYTIGTASGLVAGQFKTARRSGLSDPRIKVSMNFFGAPALRAPEFVKYRQKTIVGGSLQITLPLGQYDPRERINLGANRWSLKPELGVSRALGKWSLELYGSVTFFTSNHQYLQTSTRRQQPIVAVQGHVAYSFRPRLWAAFDAVYFGGGRTTLNGVKNQDLQTNARYGLTFSLPLARSQHSLKFLVSNGLQTRPGANFLVLGTAFQYTWGGKR